MELREEQELRCSMYMYQLTVMNIIITYYKRVLIQLRLLVKVLKIEKELLKLKKKKQFGRI